MKTRNYQTMQSPPFGGVRRGTKEKLPLNKQDIKKLQKHLIPMLLFPFLVAGMFYGFYALFLSDSNLLKDKTGQYMVVGFSVFFFGILAYMIGAYIIDLRKGFKYSITGKVTDKKLSVSTSTSSSTNNKTGTSTTRSSTSRYYYIYVDNIQYAMEQQYYASVKVGDEVTMHKAPKSNITLLFEVNTTKHESAATALENDNSKTAFLNSTPKKVPFKQADFEALKKGFYTQLKTRLLWALPIMFIIGSLLVSGMQAFLVFLFPIVLVMGYQLWKLLQEYKQYNSNKQYAYKEGIAAMVDDKTKYSHNGKNTNKVKTTLGYIKVNNQLYEKLQPGDKITVYKTAKGHVILSIKTINNQEYYLL